MLRLLVRGINLSCYPSVAYIFIIKNDIQDMFTVLTIFNHFRRGGSIARLHKIIHLLRVRARVCVII